MRSLLHFLRRHLKIIGVGIGVFAFATATGVWWWYQPAAVEFTHEPCEISYGDEIGSWRGNGEKEWNRDGMVYVARSFSITQEVKGSYRPNAYYRSDHTITSSGDYVCDESVDDYVDTNSEEYRWNGARAEALRLGVPHEIGNDSQRDVSIFSRQNDVKSKPTPESDSATAEAPIAWAEDGGHAVLDFEDNDYLVWCVNDPTCEFKRNDDESAALGSSFYYASDCDSQESTCADGRVNIADASFSKDDNAYIEPFHLKMSATSTYPPSTAAETVLVFAYSVTPDLSIQASLSAEELQAQDQLQVSVRVHSTGPRLSEGSIEIDPSKQPLRSENLRHDLSEEALGELQHEEIVRSFSLVVEEDAPAGTCFALPVVLNVRTVEGDSARAEETLSYCIERALTIYTYRIATRGDTVASVGNFAREAAETLADSRGWVRGGVGFRQVSSGGDFTLWLAAPDEMTSFSELCSAEYSCRVGRDVIVNDLRWREATDPWNEAGGNIRDYRHMVVNHEVGHLIGLGHYDCPGAGQPAPIMQQQSIDLQGCNFNPWPLQFEIDTVRDS